MNRALSFFFPSLIALVISIQCFAGENRAVVVGINDYANSGLSCCVSDAEAFADVLRAFGFSEIVLLRDRQANIATVRQTIREVGQRTSPDGVFVFFYSGHGSYIDDDNGDEQDGVDEALCLVDSQGEVELYLDDDFDKDFQGIRAKAAVAFIDSCFSGGAARTSFHGRTARLYNDFTIKGGGGRDDEVPLPRQQNDAAYLPDWRLRKSDQYGFSADKPTNANEIVYTACAADEISYESKDLHHGFFTYCLVDALTVGAPATDTDKDGYISFPELYGTLLNKVSDVTGGDQNPSFYLGNGQLEDIRLLPVAQDGSAGNAPETVGGSPNNGSGGNIDALLDYMIQSMEVAGQTEKPRYDLKIDLDKPIYHPGDSVDLKISLDDSAYLYLINVYYGGTTTLLFPNSSASNNLVPAGSQLSVQNLIGNYKLAVSDNSSGGIEYLLAIASPVPLELESLADETAAGGKIFGEFTSGYGTRGVIASLMSQAYTCTRPLQLQPLPGETDMGTKRSLAAAYVRYQVESGS